MKRTGFLKRSQPLLRKKPLNRMSAKRKKDSRTYREKRKAFLKSNPYCQACKRDDIWRDDGSSGGVGFGFRRCSQQIHHTLKRGKHYLDESTWIAVCCQCHRWIHSHPKEARKLGLLA